MAIVRGTPRYAVWAAWTAVLCVLPSAIWRTALGLGATLGTSEEWRRLQHLPGSGTAYVIGLSVATLACAGLTFALVQTWGLRFPRPLVAGTAVSGAAAVIAIDVMSILRWHDISCWGACPTPAGAALANAVYAVSLLWAPSVLVATWAFWRRPPPR